MEINILKYLPFFLQQIEEHMRISEVENDELSELWDELSNIQNENFIDDSTVYAVSRWEKILNITPLDTDTLEHRKFRVTLRLNQHIPYTYKALVDGLISLVGSDGYTLNIDYVNCTITVRVQLGVKYMFDEVKKLLDKILPCNLLLDYRLLYNTHQTIKDKNKTHAQLHLLTHRQIKEEVLT